MIEMESDPLSTLLQESKIWDTRLKSPAFPKKENRTKLKVQKCMCLEVQGSIWASQRTLTQVPGPIFLTPETIRKYPNSIDVRINILQKTWLP